MSKLIHMIVYRCNECPYCIEVQEVDDMTYSRRWISVGLTLERGHACKLTKELINRKVYNSGQISAKCPLHEWADTKIYEVKNEC